MRSYWIRVGAKSNDCCPYKKRRGCTKIHTEERRPCDDGVRDWSEAATSQETPMTAGAPEAKKRQGQVLPWSLQRKQGPADTLISDF